MDVSRECSDKFPNYAGDYIVLFYLFLVRKKRTMMKDSRRDFIRMSACAAAAVSACRLSFPAPQRQVKGVIRDAGMQMSEAYFDWVNQHKIALFRPMDVLGAVGGINPNMVGLNQI